MQAALGAMLAASVPFGGALAGDELFTAAQASRGEKLYEQHCASCHGLRLEGKAALALSGETFATRWADGKHTVDDLFYIVRTSMPNDNPGKLSKPEYLDIVVYLLHMNGYKSGSTDLPLDPVKLKSLVLTR